MGLGKTLQALAAIAIKVKERKKLKGSKGKTISLVICPSTLIHNWNNEIKKFFNSKDLKGTVYDETMRTFSYKQLEKIIPKNDILIISYEKIRAHADFFTKYKFLYIVLDEAHLI